MTRLFWWMLVGRKGQSSALHVAETVVKRGQLGPQIHDGEVHELAACGAAVFLGGADQARSEARPLQCGIDREQAEISALTAQFHVNAAEQRGCLFGEQKFALLQQSTYLVWAGSFCVDEEALHLERGVHQTRDVLGIFELRRPLFHELGLNERDARPNIGHSCPIPWMLVHRW